MTHFSRVRDYTAYYPRTTVRGHDTPPPLSRGRDCTSTYTFMSDGCAVASATEKVGGCDVLARLRFAAVYEVSRPCCRSATEAV